MTFQIYYNWKIFYRENTSKNSFKEITGSQRLTWESSWKAFFIEVISISIGPKWKVLNSKLSMRKVYNEIKVETAIRKSVGLGSDTLFSGKM